MGSGFPSTTLRAGRVQDRIQYNPNVFHMHPYTHILFNSFSHQRNYPCTCFRIFAYSHIRIFALALFIFCFPSSLSAQGKFKNYTASDGLTNNRVYATAIDADNVKWFATWDGGVSRFDGTSWKSYKSEILSGTTHIYTTRKDRLAHDDVCSAAVDADNVKWFGTHVGGVSSYDGSTWKTYTTEDGLATNNYVHAIAVDADNVKWFGTYGVASFDGTNWKTYNTENGLAYSIFAIAVGRDNVKWFGTYGGGVSCYDETTWKSYTKEDGLADNYVLAIAVDKDNVIWIGTPEGVSSFDGSNWKTYTAEDGLADNNVYSIAVDADNVKWFGTYDRGVSRYDGSSWKTYTTNEGLADNKVYSITVGTDNVIWFGTFGGGVSMYEVKKSKGICVKANMSKCENAE